MTLEFHPAVQQDFNAAIDYYAAEGGGGKAAGTWQIGSRLKCGTVWRRLSPGRGSLRFTEVPPHSDGFDSAIFLTLSSIARNWTS